MSNVSINNIFNSLSFYQRISSDFPKIKNKLEILLDHLIGRMPRRLVFIYNNKLIRVEGSGYIPLLYIYGEIFQDSCYMPEFWNCADCFGPGKVVVDIGANVGLFTMLAASYGSKVISIEPNPINYFFLLINLKKNKFANTIPLNLAVGQQAGLRSLFVAEQPSGSSFYSNQAIGNEFAVSINSITINQMFGELNLDHIDFLKVDCEGSEYEILLKQDNKFFDAVDRIALEYHRGVGDYSPEQLSIFLGDFYSKVDIVGNKDESTGFIYVSRGK
jgi:FkbM family methyltransferase